MVSRSQKLSACQAYIANLIKAKQIDSTHFSYLLPISDYVTKKAITKDSDILAIIAKYVDHGWLALFEVMEEGK